ncbi:hypothetical protein LCGC14_2960330 [marine sediment metagenome]|uniref:Uncharacterized protein n=1 Tax=marine sediment metagenome TaxID=412755 RepID=A0A0F9A3R1_9ZZZZ
MKTPWLSIYVVTCALAAGILTAGATYWNWEMGAYAAIGGAGFGFLGYLLVRYGPRHTNYAILWLEKLELALTLGLQWKKRAVHGEALLGRALTYLDHTPLEGVMDVADDIRQHFIEIEESNEEETDD